MSKSGMIDEKRNTHRHIFDEFVGVRLDTLQTFKAVNISESGIAIECDQPIEQDRRTVVTFMGNSILVSGTIRHGSKMDSGIITVGIEFEKTERELVDVLLDFNFGESHINGK